MTIRLILASAVALALPMAANAQSALERFEVLNEQIETLIFEAMAAQTPQLVGNLPAPEWNQAMRVAGECFLDGVRDEVGDEGVNTLLDNMEAAMQGVDATSLMQESGAFQPTLPDGLSDQQLQNIDSECGLNQALMMRFAESGAFSVIMESGQ
ncbi:hypothetical protein roselon_00381 [Roseibacterium elongatum DSM 19469]|uniref:Uncharacterized protein n=1 Tax=Roseicyclus elongatus DSM 19469 TaxID=1294273 RepID=W8S257_9RHOB|nr:hypothetical protein [Roseibacterium elongatum]AHM02826.1 hypothetical protein roselon_00381 [Roseibacterium elongatum DSM 19469]